VQYAAEELYAILSLESHRHQVRLVGENLGTVPAYVNTAMARHRLRQMYVLQYELTPTASQALRAVPARVVASLNTHDMAPFAAYWQGLDIADLQSQRLVNARKARQQQRQRQRLLQALQNFLQGQGWLPETPTPAVSAVLRACLTWLSTSPAEVVLVNLEDLWLETQPQNFPGTHEERPNWQGKARYSLDTLRTMPPIVALLQEIHRLRQPHSLRA
jgi:4-alpha-glucanotransferase